MDVSVSVSDGEKSLDPSNVRHQLSPRDRRSHLLELASSSSNGRREPSPKSSPVQSSSIISQPADGENKPYQDFLPKATLVPTVSHEPVPGQAAFPIEGSPQGQMFHVALPSGARDRRLTKGATSGVIGCSIVSQDPAESIDRAAYPAASSDLVSASFLHDDVFPPGSWTLMGSSLDTSKNKRSA